MRPRLFMKRALPVYLILLLTFGLLIAGGTSLAQRDVPISPTPQSSDGLRGVPVIDGSGDISSPQAFTGCANVTEIPKLECQALVKLYNDTDGSNWFFSTDWIDTDTPCTWYGITCAGGSVTDLELRANGLNGTIPPQIGNLPQLQNLNLSENQLTGKIPPQIGNLSSLKTLNLYFCRLTGIIPAEIGNLSQLETLDLTRNLLSGKIPSQIGSLTNLNSLSIQSNILVGPLPPELGNLTNLTRLSLGSIDSAGNFPLFLTQLTNLEHLALHSSELTGAIPADLEQLSNLKSLILGNNQLTGSIPAELGELEFLEGLDLSSNQLTGNIPSALGTLTNLTVLDLSNNQLDGAIPASVGGLAKLQRLYLYNNQLSGAIPPELGSLPDLEWLYLYNNQLTGVIPPQLGELDKLFNLYLSDNRLSGTLPPELGQLTALADLSLQGNQLSGDIPASFVDLSSLFFMRIDYNALTASDPGLITFLDGKIPGWQEKQTVPPDGIDVAVDPTSQDLIVNWTPIATPLPYLEKGYYQVGCDTSTSSGWLGDPLYYLYTANIHASQATFSALPAGDYYCAVRTITPAHADNENEVRSAWSAEDTGTVTEATEVQGDTFADPVEVNNLNSQFWSLNAADATADGSFPAPEKCESDIDPDTNPGIFFQLPVDLSGDISIISGGPRYFKDRATDSDLVNTVLAIYTGDTLETLVEVACDDDGGPVGGGSRINLSAFAPGSTYVAVVWLQNVGVNDAGTDGMILQVSQTQILSVNGDFSIVNPNNNKLPLDWKAKNLGTGKLLCDVIGKPSRSYSPPCAFQLVAGAKVPVLQQVIPSSDFPEPILKGTFQVAAIVKRMGTTGKTQVGFQLNFTDGKKVTKMRQRPAGNSAYELVVSPLFRVKKEVKSVRVYVRLLGKTGKGRVDDVKLYYIP